jgi:uncharacterized protein (DUF427 family)
MSTETKGHTIDLVPSDQHVRVEVGGEVVAESDRALELRETGHRLRLYVPIEDVREGVLEPSDKTTHCPYKGDASYFSVRAGGELHRDGAWTYRDPIPAMRDIAGLVCFY